eukprot:scaffold1006_cov270-Pinguiococcus_pyrenoidosus.AAC.24
MAEPGSPVRPRWKRIVLDYRYVVLAGLWRGAFSSGRHAVSWRSVKWRSCRCMCQRWRAQLGDRGACRAAGAQRVCCGDAPFQQPLAQPLRPPQRAEHAAAAAS